MPVSVVFAFKLGWGIKGLWLGCLVAATFQVEPHLLETQKSDLGWVVGGGGGSGWTAWWASHSS